MTLIWEVGNFGFPRTFGLAGSTSKNCVKKGKISNKVRGFIVELVNTIVEDGFGVCVDKRSVVVSGEPKFEIILS